MPPQHARGLQRHVGVPDADDPVHAPCDDDVLVFGEVKALDALVDVEDGLVGGEARLGLAELVGLFGLGGVGRLTGLLDLFELLLHVRTAHGATWAGGIRIGLLFIDYIYLTLLFVYL